MKFNPVDIDGRHIEHCDKEAMALYYRRACYDRDWLRDTPSAIEYAAEMIRRHLADDIDLGGEYGVDQLLTLIGASSVLLHDRIIGAFGSDDTDLAIMLKPAEPEPKEPPTSESVRREADRFAELAKIFERRAKEMEEREGEQ